MNDARRKRLELTLNARKATTTVSPQDQWRAATTQLVANFGPTAQRSQALRHLFDPRRDIDEECGYPFVITELAYRIMFDREVGRRVVNVYPEETWKRLPKIFEDPDPELSTAFEETLDDVEQRHHLTHYMQRADELSGVGHYGVILWGLDDGKTMDQPVAGFERWEESTGGISGTGTSQTKPTEATRRILFIRCLDESLVKIASYERDVTNPRYGLPNYYLVTLNDINLMDTSSLSAPTDLVQMRVHWTRVSHIADNRKTSEVLGTPRMEPVWNRLLDLRKVMGGSGEMFWRGGFPGISLETQPGLENGEVDIAATRSAMQDYMNGLQRYLINTGLTAKSLAPQIADPSNSFDVQIKAICVTLGVPYRVFMGIEEGVVSGDQATEAWAGRLQNRQSRYVTPMLINPVIQRLIDYGVLAAPAKPRGWTVEWPDLMEMSANDKADVAVKRTTAFAQYVEKGVDVLIPPLEYLTTICGLTEKEARAIVDAAVAHIGEIQAHQDDGATPPAGREPQPPEPEVPLLPAPGTPGVAGGPPKARKGVPAKGKPPAAKPKAPPTPKVK